MNTPNYLKQAVEDDTPDTDTEMIKDLGFVEADPDEYDDYGNAYDDDDDEYDEYPDYTCISTDTWEHFTSARDYFQNLANDLLQENRAPRPTSIPIILLRNRWDELSDEVQNTILDNLVHMEERIRSLHYVTENYSCR